MTIKNGHLSRSVDTLSSLLSKISDVYFRMHSHSKDGILIGFIVPDIDCFSILQQSLNSTTKQLVIFKTIVPLNYGWDILPGRFVLQFVKMRLCEAFYPQITHAITLNHYIYSTGRKIPGQFQFDFSIPCNQGVFSISILIHSLLSKQVR